MDEKKKKANVFFHVFVRLIAGILVVGGICMGIWFYIYDSTHEDTNDAQVEQYVTPIMSRITGYVSKVYFEENQFVHKGDTLVIFDNREYEAKYDLSLAELQNARENTVVAMKNVRTSKGNLAITEAQLLAIKTTVWKSKLELDRYQSLVNEDAATEQQLEKVKADYQVAIAQLQEMKNRIHLVDLGSSQAAANVPSTHSIIASKEALVDNAKLFLSYTVITAPYDGWVGKRTTQPGQLIKEGQTLVSIVSKEKWITANFKETQLQYLKVGQEVKIIADADKSRTFKGVISSLSPASGARFSLLPPDNATGNFVKIEQRIPVKIKIDEDMAAIKFLRAGMNITVKAEH
ncbi:HlyD family secretion protein [Flavobacterium sp. 7A]|uniref:HlyD family secretion protein n=1 Tax=Flavobacterium sp. 7A TaxID=2940571 RepID=UPI002226F779|nr:HlyD family secretion protein [Flavobacterium sp. 7A]MCW2121208.1 membrane fusion protein (multidrug efflux system) [Flavobacterium sp. 7A]